MPSGGDPYGNYSFHERIVRENRFFIATMTRNAAQGLARSDNHFSSSEYSGSNPSSPNRVNKDVVSPAVRDNSNRDIHSRGNEGAEQQRDKKICETLPSPHHSRPQVVPVARAPSASGAKPRGYVPNLNSLLLATVSSGGEQKSCGEESSPRSQSVRDYSRSPVRVSARGPGFFSPNYKGNRSSSSNSPTHGGGEPNSRFAAVSSVFPMCNMNNGLPPQSPTNAGNKKSTAAGGNGQSSPLPLRSPSGATSSQYTLGGILGGGTFIRSPSSPSQRNVAALVTNQSTSLPLLAATTVSRRLTHNLY